MVKKSLRREALLPKLAAHVMAHGLSGASLRPLARAAGTSDRMLLYHFGSKQALMEELLDTLTTQFAASLGGALGDCPARDRGEAFRRIAIATRAPAFRPFLALWWQIVAGAARDEPGFRSGAGRVVEAMLGWIAAQLPPDDPDPRAAAHALLAAIEGVQMLDAVGAYVAADAAVEALF